MKIIASLTVITLLLLLGANLARGDEPTRLRTVAYQVADIVTPSNALTEISEDTLVEFNEQVLPIITLWKSVLLPPLEAGQTPSEIHVCADTALVFFVKRIIESDGNNG